MTRKRGKGTCDNNSKGMIKRIIKANQRKGRNYEVDQNLNDNKKNEGKEHVTITAKE